MLAQNVQPNLAGAQCAARPALRAHRFTTRRPHLAAQATQVRRPQSSSESWHSLLASLCPARENTSFSRLLRRQRLRRRVPARASLARRAAKLRFTLASRRCAAPACRACCGRRAGAPSTHSNSLVVFVQGDYAPREGRKGRVVIDDVDKYPARCALRWALPCLLPARLLRN